MKPRASSSERRPRSSAPCSRSCAQWPSAAARDESLHVANPCPGLSLKGAPVHASSRMSTSATDSARELLSSFNSRAEPASRRAASAQWTLATNASPEAEQEAADAAVALGRLYAEDAVFEDARRLDEAGASISDPLVAREI